MNDHSKFEPGEIDLETISSFLKPDLNRQQNPPDLQAVAMINDINTDKILLKNIDGAEITNKGFKRGDLIFLSFTKINQAINIKRNDEDSSGDQNQSSLPDENMMLAIKRFLRKPG